VLRARAAGKSSKSNSSKEEKRQKKALAFYNAMQLYADISDSESEEELGVGHVQVTLPEMAAVQLLAPKIFPKEDHPCKKVSFKAQALEQLLGAPPALQRGHEARLPAQQRGRITLHDWKLFLDSCTTYHSAFSDWMLSNMHEVSTVLRGNRNAGVTSTDVKGYYGLWEFWLNKKGITNLLSIPQLGKDGYVAVYNTKRDWVVTTPSGKEMSSRGTLGFVMGCPTST